MKQEPKLSAVGGDRENSKAFGIFRIKKKTSVPEEFKVNGLIYHQNSCPNAEPVGNGRLKSKPKTLEKWSRFCNILKMLRMEL